MASHQRNSSRKVNWWSWWVRGWWTPCAGRPNVEAPARASCVRATTCVLSWSSWRWPPRRQRCTFQISKFCLTLKSLQKNWPKEHSTFGYRLTFETTDTAQDLYIQSEQVLIHQSAVSLLIHFIVSYSTGVFKKACTGSNVGDGTGSTGQIWSWIRNTIRCNTFLFWDPN